MNKKKICFIFIICLGVFFQKAFAEKINFHSDSMSGIGNSKNAITELSGNAVVTTEDIKIESDLIKLFGKDFTNITASGNVKGESKKNKFTFSSDMLKYNRTKKISEFFGNVNFFDSANETEITCDYALYDEKTEILIIKYNVFIKQKDTTCKAIFANYNRKTELVDLLGKPQVTNKDDTFNADRITINLKTEDIKMQGKVKGNLIEREEK